MHLICITCDDLVITDATDRGNDRGTDRGNDRGKDRGTDRY